jgi:hypothetical protein
MLIDPVVILSFIYIVVGCVWLLPQLRNNSKKPGRA